MCSPVMRVTYTERHSSVLEHRATPHKVVKVLFFILYNNPGEYFIVIKISVNVCLQRRTINYLFFQIIIIFIFNLILLL